MDSSGLIALQCELNAIKLEKGAIIPSFAQYRNCAVTSGADE